jgi:hypothetical protein
MGHSPADPDCLERPAVGVVHPWSGTLFRARMVGAVSRAPEVRGKAGSLEHGVQIDAALLAPVGESSVIPNQRRVFRDAVARTAIGIC